MADLDFDGVGGGFSWKIVPRLVAYGVVLVIGAFGSYWLGLQTGSFYLTWAVAMLAGIPLFYASRALRPVSVDFDSAINAGLGFRLGIFTGLLLLIFSVSIVWFLMSVYQTSFANTGNPGSTVMAGLLCGAFVASLFPTIVLQFRSRRKQGQP